MDLEIAIMAQFISLRLLIEDEVYLIKKHFSCFSEYF